MKFLIDGALPSIRDVLRLADQGDFQQAIDKTQQYGGVLPTQLFEAISRFDKESERLDAYLGARSAEVGTTRVFATWKFQSAQDWFGTALHQEGNGIVRAGKGLELVTLGQQSIAVRYSELPDSGTYIVHLLASFPSNVGDNFYCTLEGKGCSESIRFSNTNVTLVADGAVLSCVGKVIKLYTLQVNEDRVRLYVNGVLHKSKQRAYGQSFSDFVLRLIGEHGPDLSGFVHGFEIQYAHQPALEFFGDDRSLFVNRLKETISIGNVNEVYQLLKGIDDKWSEGLDELLLNLLDVQVSVRGVQEWVYDTILGSISPERAYEWAGRHRNILPSPVLSVHDLSAEFMLMPNKRFALGSVLRGSGRERFLVLNDINFDVFPGDIVGIIGPNGAGKSTLLRAIAGLLPIHRGEIILRVHHLLLSAGLGARNELTGRENIYLAGTFMGFSKSQIDKLFDEIWDFSELGQAIDKPFKYYSDGMKGRLVFSLATSVSPDLLMLDELLSAGDIKFQKKAADRMEQLLDRAKAVIVVTHSVPFVAQRCNKALLIAGGRLAAYGDPKEVISHYLNVLHMGDASGDSDFNPLEMNMQQQQQVGGFGSSDRH